MRGNEYARMAEREANYWWHVGRLKIIETYLEKTTRGKRDVRILNVGCGTGGTMPVLERYGTVDSVDVSDEAIASMRRLGYNRVQKMTGPELPCLDASYDIVGAFDVLEHIENDAAALREWGRALREDGSILLTVPAYQWLWSSHDVALHHFRRYSMARLKRVAATAGFATRQASYAFVFSLPLVAGFRFLQKKGDCGKTPETSYVDVPSWVNSAFTQLLFLEAKAHRYLPFPAGTSIIARLQKS